MNLSEDHRGIGASKGRDGIAELDPMGSSIAEGELMFGPDSMNKALCGCGALVDLDAETLRRKKGLGKRIECVRCRNRRVADERELLERQFQGLDGEEQQAY